MICASTGMKPVAPPRARPGRLRGGRRATDRPCRPLPLELAEPARPGRSKPSASPSPTSRAPCRRPRRHVGVGDVHHRASRRTGRRRGWPDARRPRSGVPTCCSMPSFMTTMRSASAHGLDLVVGDVDGGRALLSMCRRLISARMSSRSLASSAPIGSSISIAFGRRTSARPMATRCMSPPDSADGLRAQQAR